MPSKRNRKRKNVQSTVSNSDSIQPITPQSATQDFATHESATHESATHESIIPTQQSVTQPITHRSIAQESMTERMTERMITNYTMSEDMVMIKKFDYDTLQRERDEERKMNEMLKHNADMLREELRRNEQFIKTLEKTNNDYKIKIEELIRENIKLKDQISKLEEKINLMELDMNYQKDENDKMKLQINILMERDKQKEEYKLFSKIALAIQDLNREFHLETLITDIGVINSLVELRNVRNDDCHYLHTKYQKINIDGRLFVMKKKFDNMPIAIKNQFDDDYPNLISEIDKFMDNILLNRSNPKLTQKEINDIDKWWNN